MNNKCDGAFTGKDSGLFSVDITDTKLHLNKWRKVISALNKRGKRSLLHNETQGWKHVCIMWSKVIAQINIFVNNELWSKLETKPKPKYFVLSLSN